MSDAGEGPLCSNEIDCTHAARLADEVVAHYLDVGVRLKAATRPAVPSPGALSAV
ncbi:hypothetical protein EV132_11250 [Rhizobium sullae]|uniref:Uncharacterized protein n=1 Tax=Rhizobium sullae TaxID=50338 RepID=A0A4R3Q2I8_RHISU|nr:hypothetical protein EV132_11250 [Rhizobium sullae]